MKKLVLVLAVVLVLSGIFAVAALTQVQMERDITATVGSDTDPNVAILFTVITGYGDVAYLTDANEIMFDLSGALTTADYFNPEATFVIGASGAGNGVFTITNNSNVGINVSVTQDPGYVDLLDVAGATVPAGGVDIAAGAESVEFHFSLNTAGAMPGVPETPVNISEQLVITQQ